MVRSHAQEPIRICSSPVERLVEAEGVCGSIPHLSTKIGSFRAAAAHLKVVLELRQVFNPAMATVQISGIGRVADAPAFQAGYMGSIPICRTKMTLSSLVAKARSS